MKPSYAETTIAVLFDAMLRGKEITETEIENTIDEIMATVTKVASDIGKRVNNG